MNHSTQKLWTSYFLESSDQLIEQDHWLTLASFPDRMHHEHLYILLQSSNILAHFSVTHESFTVHITHSTKNFFCIALLSMKKLNYTLRLTGLLKACLHAHYKLRTEDMMQSMGLLDNAQQIMQNLIGFSLWFSFRNWLYLEKKSFAFIYIYTPRKYRIQKYLGGGIVL